MSIDFHFPKSETDLVQICLLRQYLGMSEQVGVAEITVPQIGISLTAYFLKYQSIFVIRE